VVVFVDLCEVMKREFSGFHEVARLEHEGHVCLCNFIGFLLRKHEFLVGISVRTVRSHS
jgi:hypothetical protein